MLNFLYEHVLDSVKLQTIILVGRLKCMVWNVIFKLWMVVVCLLKWAGEFIYKFLAFEVCINYGINFDHFIIVVKAIIFITVFSYTYATWQEFCIHILLRKIDKVIHLF